MPTLLALLAAQAAAPAGVPVAVLAHPIDRGTRVAASDFVIERRPAGQAQGALAPAAADGLEATHPLPAGQVVRRGDLSVPQLVHRGDGVTITLHSGPLSITTTGRALTGGGLGEPVRVVSQINNRTLDAVVESEGHVGLIAR
ncbi:flagellar basal body P-ring formation chaperone FlgA [Sphingomonas sp. RIT328]|uniref:flagellar basal body P-ring formation chaperone FlgA n=1 Tax=Sphingomonas sp. RIT328 TaxID=1470591 RepID=UPI00044D4128|nr:flagellar basal body P-ring formation chaperone FlgA [Sphingomonas sp. RIT328]EZP48673.1 Flagellar basal body P-ring biosynthesis protein FlgA [Sphingomonas sp. RIT328]